MHIDSDQKLTILARVKDSTINKADHPKSMTTHQPMIAAEDDKDHGDCGPSQLPSKVIVGAITHRP